MLRIYSRALYRGRQFLHGFFAKITSEERQQVQQLLSSAQYTLFCRMPMDAQRHSLNVCQTLLDAGKDDPDLMVAALLHDVGKVAAEESGTRLGLWMRGPIVILETLRPELLQRWASPKPSDGWRYAIHVQLMHPQIGADWAAEAGASAKACWLIAMHQEKDVKVVNYPEGEKERVALLADLQWADSRN